MVNSEDQHIEVVESILDFANAVESAVVNLRLQLEGKQTKPKSLWNPSLIKWVSAEGEKGPYERSEDVNNLQFKALLKDLGEHGGKFFKNGYFYWSFKNGYVIGRKKSVKRGRKA